MQMASHEILFLSGALMVLFLVVGIVVGWVANDFLYNFMQSRANLPRHPEMYDDNGIVINEELLTVNFVDDDDDDYDDD